MPQVTRVVKSLALSSCVNDVKTPVKSSEHSEAKLVSGISLGVQFDAQFKMWVQKTPKTCEDDDSSGQGTGV
jgi:hypothetical protein